MKNQWMTLFFSTFLFHAAQADVEIITDRAVVGSDDVLEARLRFPVADEGDLYVAARIGEKLRFYGEDGKFHSMPVPYRRTGPFHQEETIFRFPGMMVPPGRYILYSVVTDEGADVYDTHRWHGPLARQLFIANQPPQMSGDHDGDGWPDDDDDHDGFSEMDHDYDGWRDDDGNRNGIPDRDEEHSRGVKDRPVPPPAGASSGQGGAALYAQHCAGCHGDDPARGYNDIYEGWKVSEIQEAIAENKGGMGFLGNLLSSGDVGAVAAYIHTRTGGR